MTYPHCDDLVLHAPGECMYCDRHSLEQHERIRDGINFTGQNDPTKSACPSTARRPLGAINRWGGNVPVKTVTVTSDNLAPADKLPDFGECTCFAEPAHVTPVGAWLLVCIVTGALLVLMAWHPWA